MRYVTSQDFTDIFIKLNQRGLPFLLSKLSLNTSKRTKSAFNESEITTSNFWNIPLIRKRWNFLITGNEDHTYEEYLSEKFFQNAATLKLLSLGSGICSHEIKLAELNPHWEIHCFDFSDILLKNAKGIADKKGLDNIHFYPENIIKYNFDKEAYDVVFFHASLHHFEKIDNFLKNTVNKTLKQKGYLIINEFVGADRMQYSDLQIQWINKALKSIPKKYRKIFKTNLYKKHYYGYGIIRMIIADPSECVDSFSIMPSIHKHYKTIAEKPYGNNLLSSVFKDIAHHFTPEEGETLISEKRQVLERIFKMEDEFLKDHKSDYVFGIYQLR